MKPTQPSNRWDGAGAKNILMRDEYTYYLKKNIKPDNT